jgi:hypothetical protein
MFRITPSLAANALRTYRARFADAYRARLQTVLATVSPKGQTRAGTGVLIFEFDDPAVLDYAVERLRRRRLTRSVSVVLAFQLWMVGRRFHAALMTR